MYYVHKRKTEKKRHASKKNARVITVKVRISAQHLLSAHTQ